MPTFRVRGTKRQTGEPIVGRMKAASLERAEAHCREQGITITELTEIEPPEAPPPEGPPPEAPPPEGPPAEAPPREAPPPEAPPASAQDEPLAPGQYEFTGRVLPGEGTRVYVRAPVPVRPYSAVAMIIIILRIVGAALAVLFGLILIGGFIGASQGGAMVLIIAFLIAIAFAVAAVLVVALAELLQMQRDVAQNSARLDERLANLQTQRPPEVVASSSSTFRGRRLRSPR